MTFGNAGLAVRMAMAEKAAGNLDQARALLTPFTEPFIRREHAAEIMSVLGAAQTDSGKVTPFLVASGDGSVEVAEKAGRKCVVTQREYGKSYIYFALPEHAGFRDQDTTVRLGITYYAGSPSARFRVHYDSHYSDDIPGFYRDAGEVVPPPQAPGWQTAVLECPRARLAGHQNDGADFRIAAAEGDGDIYIAQIELERAP